MANIARNFVAGKMNKVVDQRLLPEGEYIDAMNIRMGDTENSEIGVIENAKGNDALTKLTYIDGTPLSINAKCIGAIEDSANETIYWFVHDKTFNLSGNIYRLDMIVSFNVNTNVLTYHVVSINTSTNVTILNFNENYLITGINIIENLLFFTDNYNPPRVINIKRSYDLPVSNIDQITAEELLVIKKPPVAAPEITLIKTTGESNYLDTRFICFAYRYKYADGEYSATSQWSAPAFVPNTFNFSIESLLNEGMVNLFNAAIIKYNSGGPLVVGVDLLFKQSTNNIIKVIEKLDKEDLGMSNNQFYQYTFSNSKIFTILPESEILRLYDNVPLYAKAQTIMGNRLMYGNYIEGYDLLDSSGQPVQFNYYTSLLSEKIGLATLSDSTGPGNYTAGYYPLTVPNSVVYADLTGIDLIEGASITISFTFSHSAFSGYPPSGFPTQTTNDVQVSFTFILPTSYNSVYEMATSTEFAVAVGNGYGMQPMATACNGTTFGDQINCLIPNTLTNSTTTFTKEMSEISPGFIFNQGPSIIVSPSSNLLGLQMIAMKYSAGGLNVCWEYYYISFAEAFFQSIANPSSLHSNRGYEVGIVYMDDFNRATTALVSKNNTEHVGCGLSAFRNSIQVTIPTSQKPPYWATRYKFVIKPDEEGYETIYSNIYFIDSDTNNAYFLLEGENARKVQAGDRFIVKADSDGPTKTCVYATVLEKEVKSSGFITTVSNVTPPAGVYMKINPNEFSVVDSENSIISYGRVGGYVDGAGDCATFEYPMSYPDPVSGMYVNYDVPAGSKIVISIRFERGGRGCSCEKRIYTLEKILTSSANYGNMEEWFIGDNVENILDDGIFQGDCGAVAPANTFQPGHGMTACNVAINYYRFDIDGTNNRLYFRGSGTQSCAGAGRSGRRSYAYATITVFRAEKTFIFETEPIDALPDVFFENELSLPIQNGFHLGNVQNQTSSLPAIINTEFFNCFSFGNGAESYKIRDSIVGRSFSFGERVTSVSAQDYKQAHRFSDITYSGIYNPESNINKLNEFNLGLLNYKHLESSFGNIYILDGRETDVLVLQEDKISYVLAGKNLLSDAAAGGAITSVPEVLGTQIARTEKYGISFNPESYVQWGADRFFTDSKRGVVLQLKGDSYSSDQLGVISESGMRTWFRDEFNASFNTQKLGGFDPYLNEYVLSSNQTAIPSKVSCIECGIIQNISEYNQSGNYYYCVNLGQNVGQTTIRYNVSGVQTNPFVISFAYNGTNYTTGSVYTSGTISFNKNLITETNISVQVSSPLNPNLNISVLVECPVENLLNVVQVVLTNDSEAGNTIHAEYFYNYFGFLSPTQSNLVVFASGASSPLVSWYNITSGIIGTGGFPVSASTVTMQTNKIPPDTYDWNPPTDKLRYLRSNTLYPNTTTGMNNLLTAASTISTVTVSGQIASGNFTMPSTGIYLYLIWDLRKSVSASLCYSSASTSDACCGCALTPP